LGRRFKSDLQPEQSNAETILSILSIPVHSKAEWIDQAIDRDRSLSRAPTSDIEYAMSPRSSGTISSRNPTTHTKAARREPSGTSCNPATHTKAARREPSGIISSRNAATHTKAARREPSGTISSRNAATHTKAVRREPSGTSRNPTNHTKVVRRSPPWIHHYGGDHRATIIAVPKKFAALSRHPPHPTIHHTQQPRTFHSPRITSSQPRNPVNGNSAPAASSHCGVPALRNSS
jgi:hypothetical protein